MSEKYANPLAALLRIQSDITAGKLSLPDETAAEVDNTLGSISAAILAERGPKYFEITLPGFDAGTDETDHLVKWVLAADLATVEAYLPESCGVTELELRPGEGDIDYMLPAEGPALRTTALQLLAGIDPSTSSPLPTPADILEVARQCGLRSQLHGVRAADARHLLIQFVEAWRAALANVPTIAGWSFAQTDYGWRVTAPGGDFFDTYNNEMGGVSRFFRELGPWLAQQSAGVAADTTTSG